MESTVRIGTKLFVGLGAVLMLAIGAGGAGIWATTQVKSDLDAAVEEARHLQLALRIAATLAEIEGERRLLMNLAAYGYDRPMQDSVQKGIDGQVSIATGAAGSPFSRRPPRVGCGACTRW